jgi:hypothetical protein
LDNPPPADEESEEEPEDQVPEAEETEEEKIRARNCLDNQVRGQTLRVTDDLKIRVGEEVKEDVVKPVRPPAETAEVGDLKKDGSNL